MSHHASEMPDCCYCGATGVELRWHGMATRTKPCDPICEDCYTPQQIGGDDSNGFPPACGVMDGPGFDDLPLCTAALTKSREAGQ
jgi:hypothetical protein